MRNLLLLLGFLSLSFPTFSQANLPSFPNDFLGVYKGTLVMYLPNDSIQKLPMEFHLLETDSAHRFEYKLVYDGQPRDYTLVEKDSARGIYEIDENNGIILPCRFKGNTLFSFFEVGENFLSSRLSFSKEQLEFEILFTPMAEKVRTGEDTEYEIYGYPITTVHKALLQREQ